MKNIVEVAPFQYHVLECENIYLSGQRNIGIIYEVPGDVSDLQMKYAALRIFELYPALKSTFKKKDEEWSVFIKEHHESELYSELNLAENETMMDVASGLFHEFNCALNISKGSLCRFMLLKKQHSRSLLFFGNHMLYDKISLRNIELTMWKLFYNVNAPYPKCRFFDWLDELSHYFTTSFDKDAHYWLDAPWDKSSRLSTFKYSDNLPATRQQWKYQFSKASSEALLNSVGNNISLIDLLLVRLNIAVSEFTGPSPLSIELWDNGRNSLRDRLSVGPFASFFPFVIDQPSGTLFSSAKELALKRLSSPPKYGYLLGCFRKGNISRSLFREIPVPQFKVDFIGHTSGFRQSQNKLARTAKIPKLISVDHSSYSHISLVFSIECGVITMYWSHSSAAYRKEDLQGIAKIMTQIV